MLFQSDRQFQIAPRYESRLEFRDSFHNMWRVKKLKLKSNKRKLTMEMNGRLYARIAMKRRTYLPKEIQSEYLRPCTFEM